MANGRTYDHLRTLLLRLFFGVMFLPAGLGKFQDLAAFYQSIETSVSVMLSGANAENERRTPTS